MPEPYIPLQGRVKAVTVVFVLAALAFTISACSGLLEVQLMNKLIAGTQVSDAELNSNDSRQQLIAAVTLLLFVACAIVFISWLWAAYKNVDVVAPSERRYSDSWAIFGWFVPFMALWRPKQVVNDVWRAGGKDPVDAQPGGVLMFWWGFWLSLTILAVVARGYEDAETPGVPVRHHRQRHRGLRVARRRAARDPRRPHDDRPARRQGGRRPVSRAAVAGERLRRARAPRRRARLVRSGSRARVAVPCATRPTI